MSDTSFGRGGVIDVDPESLRDAARVVWSGGRRVERAYDELRASVDGLLNAGATVFVNGLLGAAISHTANTVKTIDEVTHSLRDTADAYQYAELRARAASEAATPDERRRLLASAASIAQRHPEVDDIWRGYAKSGSSHGLSASAIMLMALARRTGLPLQSAATTPADLRREVSVRVIKQECVLPVSSTAEMLRRIPHGDTAARIRIDEYHWSDRPRAFHVYISGTKTFMDIARTEPFDMSSNVDAYRGRGSASKASVEKAMSDAGITKKDEVHFIGHSQGGMLANQLALDGWNVRSVVAAGSPIEAELPESVMAINIRHDNDPVALGQGGGSDTGVGSPRSFVASRTVPDASLWSLDAHSLTEYMKTAEDIDSDANPWQRQVLSLHDSFRGAMVESSVYTAWEEASKAQEAVK